MLTLFVLGAGGGERFIVPAADFFVCCGSIRDLKKALEKVKKVRKGLSWKLLIIKFLLVPPRLSCKLNSALPLNYISERCFRVISFTPENLASQKTVSHN